MIIMKGGSSTSDDDPRTDQDVIEATAALKGMLGIGGPATSPSSAVAVEAADQAPVEDHGALVESSPTAPPKSKKPNKKKKNKGKGNTTNTTTTNEGPGSSTSIDKDVREAEPKAGDGATRNQKKKKPPKKKKESENYAWSAFQSSPDASKLPIPAFASPSGEKERLPSTVAEATTPLQLNSSEDVSEAASGLMNEVVAPLPEEQVQVMESLEPVKPNLSGGDDKEDPGESNHQVPLEESEKEITVSETGVNLAAAMAAPLPADPSAEGEFSKLTGQPVSHLNHPQHSVPTFGGLPQMYPYPQPPRFMPPSGSAANYPAMAIPPPPPPGYITIQVQVPPVLLSGRQMIVTSPAGYPVQVLVPEGIPPGMIIPVHVPAGPPMHMMPPPHPSSYGGYYNPPAPHR